MYDAENIEFEEPLRSLKIASRLLQRNVFVQLQIGETHLKKDFKARPQV